jgi:hypothetical protein
VLAKLVDGIVAIAQAVVVAAAWLAHPTAA